MSNTLLARIYSTIDDRCWDLFRELFREDVVYERPGAPQINGLEELIHFYRDIRPIAESHHDLTQVVSDGSVAACAGRLVARDFDGNQVDQRFADIYTLYDGKVQSRTTYFFRGAV